VRPMRSQHRRGRPHRADHSCRGIRPGCRSGEPATQQDDGPRNIRTHEHGECDAGPGGRFRTSPGSSCGRGSSAELDDGGGRGLSTVISSFEWPSRSVWDRLEFHDQATVPDTGGTKAASRGALSVAAGTGCHRASFAPAPVEHGIAHAGRIVAELLPRRRVVCTIPRRLGAADPRPGPARAPFPRTGRRRSADLGRQPRTGGSPR
jgi:hypothetical protein